MNEKEIRDKIVNFLRQNGPSHPVQIGKILGKDGLMTSAILSEVVKEGSIKRTARNVGNTPLFFISGQEDVSKKMVMESLNLVEKKVVEKVKKSSFVFHSDLTTQDKFVISGLKDFLVPLKVKLGETERVIWKYYDVSNEKILPSITEKLKPGEKKPEKKLEKAAPIKPPAPSSKESIFGEKKPEKKLEKAAPAGTFQSKVESWLSSNGFEIKERDVKRKGKEIEYLVIFKEPISQKYFVKCKDKKRVSESDISLTYTEGMQKKMPAMFITTGKVSKKTRGSVEKKFGGLIKIIFV